MKLISANEAEKRICAKRKDGISDWQDAYNEGLSDAQDIILDLYDHSEEKPSERWIPVSERLPKKDEYVDDVCKYCLIQDEYGDMHVACYKRTGWIPIEEIKALGCEVVAWMELPEKYGGEDHEQVD